MSISMIGAVALDLCVFVWAVFFELFRSVALLLGAFESSSAWVNDDKDDDSLYSRAPRVATPAWLKATSTPSFVCCVCVLLPRSFSLRGKGLLGLPTQVNFNKHPEA